MISILKVPARILDPLLILPLFLTCCAHVFTIFVECSHFSVLHFLHHPSNSCLIGTNILVRVLSSKALTDVLL